MTADSLRYARQDPASLWAARQMGLKALDSVNDVRAINDYLKDNEPPWERQIREANEMTESIMNAGKDQADNFANTIAQMQDDFRGQINDITGTLTAQMANSAAASRESSNRFLSAQQAAFDQRYGALENAFNAQTDAFNDLNLQYSELSAQNAEQQRLAANASRASVPTPVQSADIPTAGDMRSEAEGMRRGKDNNLSNLTVLTGLNTGGSADSGLQLA